MSILRKGDFTMKKINLLMVLVFTLAGAFAQASAQGCPLLKKQQLRSDTSTAFFPNQAKSKLNKSLEPSQGQTFIGN